MYYIIPYFVTLYFFMSISHSVLFFDSHLSFGELGSLICGKVKGS